MCFVQNLSPSLDKLSPRSIKYVFVRYSRTYNPSTKKYYVSADVIFFESVPYYPSDSPGILSALVPLPLFVPLSSPELIPDVAA